MATNAEIKSFINTLGALAVAECNKRIAEGKGFVLPSICIAQSAHETGWGSAGIMVKANAYFGIKAGGSWTGAVYRADTWEVANGEAYNTTANFRAYPSLAASVADYYELITTNSRYANGISYGADSSKWLTPKASITAIWSGGYATDTLYVEKIMNIVNGRDLTYYDTQISGTPPVALSFTKADFTQGAYVAGDSGRSLSLNTADTLAISLKTDKQITLERASTLTFSSALFGGLDGLKTKIVYVVDDTFSEAWLDEMNYTITLPAGAIVALSLYKLLTAPYDFTPLPYDVMPAFTIEVSEGLGTLPDHVETAVNGIAYFVKVE